MGISRSMKYGKHFNAQLKFFSKLSANVFKLFPNGIKKMKALPQYLPRTINFIV